MKQIKSEFFCEHFWNFCASKNHKKRTTLHCKHHTKIEARMSNTRNNIEEQAEEIVVVVVVFVVKPTKKKTKKSV